MNMNKKEIKFTIICEKCGNKLKLFEDTVTGEIIYTGDNDNGGISLFGMNDDKQQAVLCGLIDKYISLDIYCGCGNKLYDIDINHYTHRRI